YPPTPILIGSAAMTAAGNSPAATRAVDPNRTLFIVFPRTAAAPYPRVPPTHRIDHESKMRVKKIATARTTTRLDCGWCEHESHPEVVSWRRAAIGKLSSQTTAIRPIALVDDRAVDPLDKYLNTKRPRRRRI